MAIDEKKLGAIKKKNASIIKKLSKLLIFEYDRYGIKISKARSLEMLIALAASNIFNTKEGQVTMQTFNGLIQQAFINGIKYQGGAKTTLTTQYSEVLSDTAASFVTKLGETLKTETLALIQSGTADPDKQFSDIVKDVQELLDNKTYEATRIVRTETMRAANSAGYAQAISEGKRYYIVDSRAEACRVCKKKFTGEVFDIEDSDPMPPLHPNCACVPMFFDDLTDATRWATKISNDIDKQVKQLEDKGLTVNPDGTGAEVNKMKPDRRLKN